MKKILSIFILNIFCLAATFAQDNVSNIRVELRDTMLHITYNLAKKSNISVYYSSSNGMKYIGPLSEISGDLGKNVEPGVDREILWNPIEEVGYIEAPNSIIKIIAEQIPEPKPVVVPEPEPAKVKTRNLVMVGATLMDDKINCIPISLMYGRYRHFGWYAKFESDLLTDRIINPYFSTDLDYISAKAGFLWNINNKLGLGA